MVGLEASRAYAHDPHDSYVEMEPCKLVRVTGTALVETQERAKRKSVDNPVGKTASTEDQEYTLDGSGWDGEVAGVSSTCIATLFLRDAL